MINKFIRKLIPNSLINYLRQNLGVPDQKSSLKRIKKLGFQPNYCLDIGAYEGTWTQGFKNIFPNCCILMIDGQREKEPILRKIKSAYANVDYQIALLGAEEKIVTFNIYETASSVLTEHNVTNAKVEERTLSTLDSIIRQKNIKPDFIKIDTQGYEMEILKGGDNALLTAEFVLLEVSFLDIYINCPLAADVISYMQRKDFVIYDICTLMKRPLDKALFQADILFAKNGSRFRSDKRWS